jgi:hypothetical protein
MRCLVRGAAAPAHVVTTIPLRQQPEVELAGPRTMSLRRKQVRKQSGGMVGTGIAALTRCAETPEYGTTCLCETMRCVLVVTAKEVPNASVHKTFRAKADMSSHCVGTSMKRLNQGMSPFSLKAILCAPFGGCHAEGISEAPAASRGDSLHQSILLS